MTPDSARTPPGKFTTLPRPPNWTWLPFLANNRTEDKEREATEREERGTSPKKRAIKCCCPKRHWLAKCLRQGRFWTTAIRPI